MKLFGREVFASSSAVEKNTPLMNISAPNTFWGFVRESFAGAWQSNVILNREEVLSYFAVYTCIDLISRDIAKMRLKLMQQDEMDIWSETTSPSFSPVMNKPNHYQTRIKFFESWLVSKLIHGNTYVLKQRDNRGVVTAMYVLDPFRVIPLVSETGDVYYRLNIDFLAGLTTSVTVPASEIIHDKAVTMFHPMLGVSPLFACGLAAMQGTAIQTNASKLFQNMSRPSGILTAPGTIANDTAQRLKEQWETNYSGNNVGKTAVLGDGLKYEALTITAVDAQMIEHLKMTAEVVCGVFHVPLHMVTGPSPTLHNIEALNQQYYSQALQSHIEEIELLLDEGLGLSPKYSSEFDLGALLRMDTSARFKSYSDGISGGWLEPNQARFRENLPPVDGGDTPYLQQQNYSLAALAKRDAGDPFPKPVTPVAPSNGPPTAPPIPAPTATPPAKQLEHGPELFLPPQPSYEAELVSALFAASSPLAKHVEALENVE